LGKLKQLKVENYQFGKYDDDPSVQKVKKKQRKKEDLLVAYAVSRSISQGQSKGQL